MKTIKEILSLPFQIVAVIGGGLLAIATIAAAILWIVAAVCIGIVWGIGEAIK